MAPMRIFTGIALDDEVRRNVLKELQPFQKAGIPMRWTDERNIHLTLKFIGEVAEAEAARVGAVLEALPPASSFRLRLRGFGKFPAGNGLHVLWAGVEESLELRALFAVVEDALAALGIPRDTRPFHPHVTLGRSTDSRSGRPGTSGLQRPLQPSVRGRTAGQESNGVMPLLREKGDLFLGEWEAAAHRLYSSRLTPAGPSYTVLKEIPLVES